MAPRPRSRQSLLTHEGRPRSANEAVVAKPLLSASTLASWFHCNTKPFVERVLERIGIDTSNYAMRMGALAHEEVQGALEALAAPSELTLGQALARGAFLFETEPHLVDKRRRLHGFLDILFTSGGRLHVVELKNTRPPGAPDPLWQAPVWPDHAVQLLVYGLLARATFGVRPRLSLSYLKGGSRQVVLSRLAESGDPENALLALAEASTTFEPTQGHQDLILRNVRAFHRAERQPIVPPPSHSDPGRCAGCRVRTYCPFRMDGGTHVRLDLRLLTEPGVPPGREG